MFFLCVVVRCGKRAPAVHPVTMAVATKPTRQVEEVVHNCYLIRKTSKSSSGGTKQRLNTESDPTHQWVSTHIGRHVPCSRGRGMKNRKSNTDLTNSSQQQLQLTLKKCLAGSALSSGSRCRPQWRRAGVAALSPLEPAPILLQRLFPTCPQSQPSVVGV